MRQTGDILLISCYELGHQPLGIAWPSGFLERAGFRPELLDLSRDPFPEDRIRRARLIGISAPMHTALRIAATAAERIRRINPLIHLCIFGLYAALNAEYLLESLADSVLGGELEEGLVDLARVLEAGRSLDTVPGLRLRGRPAPPTLTRLRFALPGRSGLRPLSEYVALESRGERRRAGYVEASRGCLHRCRHCPIPPVYQGRFFIVPPEVVAEDIRRQADAGASHITFGDPDFLNGPGHSLPLVRRMHSEFPRLTFDFTAKIEHLLKHRSLLPELASSGCLFAVSAVESLNDRVLRILDKGHTRRDVMEALGLTRRAGITLRPSLVPFTPWSTLDDYAELLEFVGEESLVEAVDPVQFSVRLLVPPGSWLLKVPEAEGRFGPLDRKSFMHPWVHPDPRMDRLQRGVSSLVEKAGHDREAPHRTFERIRDLFDAVSGTEWAGHRPIPFESDPRTSPRLTEPWFC
jgi:radical SAM superfamily enzyme YgiQ (UPF0313 family)